MAGFSDWYAETLPDTQKITTALACIAAFAPCAAADDLAPPISTSPPASFAKIERIEAVLREHPHDLNAIRARAGYYAARGKYQLALDDFNRIDSIDPGTFRRRIDLYIWRAQCYEAVGRYEPAAMDVLNFLAYRSKVSDWHRPYWCSEAARILLEAGKYNDSLKWSEAYLSYSQQHATAYANRAICLTFLGKRDEALADLTDMLRLKLSPADLAKHNLCTQELINLCRSRFAADVRSKPNNQAALFGQALVETIGTGFDKAVADTTAILKSSPRAYDALLLRGLNYVALKQKEQALADINKAIELNPAAPVCYKVLEYYYLSASGVDDLVADLGQRVQKNPNNLVLLMAEAHAYRVARKVEKERAVYDNILKQNPKYSTALFCRGEVAQALESPRAAIEFFSKSLNDTPEDAKALKYRAACYMQQAEYTKAIADLNRVIKLCEDPNAYLARDQCLSKIR
jgi:tetratricopeptide (TPR) repeat protein